MHDWLLTLARLACPGVMMWMMMRGHRRDVSLAAAPGDLGRWGPRRAPKLADSLPSQEPLMSAW